MSAKAETLRGKKANETIIVLNHTVFEFIMRSA